MNNLGSFLKAQGQYMPREQIQHRDRGGDPGDVIPRGYREGKIQNFTPEQTQLFQQSFGQVSPDSYLARLASGDQSFFDQLEAPAIKQFGQLQRGLASQFSGAGSFGARRSSGFQNQQSQAASDFAQQLQGNRMGLQRQAIMDLMNITQMLLGQRPTDKFLSPKHQGTNWGSVLGQLGGAALNAAGSFFGGPVGGMAAGALSGGLQPGSISSGSSFPIGSIRNR